MNFFEIKTAEEYMDLVRKYNWLVDRELKKAEIEIEKDPINGPNGIINSIPKLISLVNVVGYLRGQDGAFLDERPDDVISHQSELNENENAFESRLIKIIKIVYEDPRNREKYEWRVTSYFLKARLSDYFPSSDKKL